jgi:hypothetical protein
MPGRRDAIGGRSAQLAWRENLRLVSSVKRRSLAPNHSPETPHAAKRRRTGFTAHAGHADRQEPPAGILVSGDDEARGSKPCRHRTRGGAQGGARDLGWLLEPAARSPSGTGRASRLNGSGSSETLSSNVPLVSPKPGSGDMAHHTPLILWRYLRIYALYSPVLELELALVAGQYDVGGLIQQGPRINDAGSVTLG